MSRAIIAARISGLPWRRSLEHRASCVAVATRTSTGVAVATRTSTGVACAPALEVPPPRDLGDAAACPHKGPRCRSPSGSGSRRHRPGNRRHYSGSRNLRHRASRSWSCGHWLGVHCRARSRATAVVARSVANESGWSVKNWTLALRVLFYRRPDVVQLDWIAPSDLGFF
jgi:hypothetical protein